MQVKNRIIRAILEGKIKSLVCLGAGKGSRVTGHEVQRDLVM